jgi:deoxycytidylate deaminase
MYSILDIGFFRLARNTSKFSDHRVKIGAVVSNKKPISAASNRVKTHPRYANPDNSVRGSVHAEVRAIINSERDDLRGAEIYVYREHLDGTPALARPCSNCMELLAEVGIRNIYYTCEEYPFYKREKL